MAESDLAPSSSSSKLDLNEEPTFDLTTNTKQDLKPDIEKNQDSLEDDEESSDELTTPLLLSSNKSDSSLNSMDLSTVSQIQAMNPDNQHCHSDSEHMENIRNESLIKVKKKLFAAVIFCLLFASAEAVGGYISGSYAIMTDAAHMLSDFANLVIGLVAVSVSSIKPKKSFNFGLIRAEAIGALFSVFLIWNVAIYLLYESINRIIQQDFEIESLSMMIAGGCAVLFNIFMLFFLRGLPHSHSHGGSGPSVLSMLEQQAAQDGHTRFYNEDEERGGASTSTESNPSVEVQSSPNHSHNHRHHLNIRAAAVHALGDVFQSTGVFIISIVIRLKPEWKILDPICSVLFCFVVIYTTIFVFWDTLKILMEGAPKDIKFEDVESDLSQIARVVKVHDLRLWCLTSDKNALAVHLAADMKGLSAEYADNIVQEATRIARKKYNVSMITVQVENFRPEVMNNCEKCQPI